MKEFLYFFSLEPQFYIGLVLLVVSLMALVVIQCRIDEEV